MAEYVYDPVQRVQANQNVLLQDSIPCNKGYVYHRNGSGILTLRGIVNNSCGCFARYQVTFNGNIAIPSDGTAPAPIAVALSIYHCAKRMLSDYCCGERERGTYSCRSCSGYPGAGC